MTTPRTRQDDGSGRGWSLRSWIITALVAVPVVLLQKFTGFEYPSWVRWACIAIAFFVGTAILVSPRLLDIKPIFARTLGAVAVFAAALAAYPQFSQSAPE